MVRFEAAGAIDEREYHLEDSFNKNKREIKGCGKERNSSNWSRKNVLA
jgi:hypothetical protein